MRGNLALLDAMHRIAWDIELPPGLRRDGTYLVVANHQSWVDIPVLYRALGRELPFLRFFIKDQLKWVPILGQAWWALDMPFMKRYPRELLERRPELRGRDLEATRRSCERLRGTPVAILNFVEGTRFRPEKHRRQASPYRHLLRPRAGGIAQVLAAMGDQIQAMLDVTIAYPGGAPSFWDLLAGKIDRVRVRARVVEIPPGLRHGDYDNDPAYRERFQAWVRQLWEAKDRELEDLLCGRESGAQAA